MHGEPVSLTNTEFELARCLFRHEGRMLSRGHLLETVWGRSANVKTRTVDTYLSRLRKKLSIGPETGWRLNSIYQHGYRLERVGRVESD
jgi:DNA-binding response OmpR family regulator